MTLNIILAFIFSFFYSLMILLQQKYLRTSISPLQLNFFTYLGSSAILTLCVLFFKRSILGSLPKSGLKYAILVGLNSSVVGDSLIFLGLLSSSAINWGILSLLIALVTFILSVKFLAEKPTKIKIIALILSLLGAFIVIYKPGQKLIFNSGDIFFLLAVIVYAIGNLLNKKALDRLSVFQVLYFRLLTASFVLGIILVLSNQINLNLPWFFIFISSIWMIMGTSLVNAITQKSGPSFFAISVNLVPIFTIVLAVFLFSELVTTYQLLGGVLVIGSILIFNKYY